MLLVSVECGVAEISLDTVRALVDASVVVVLRAAALATFLLIVVAAIIIIVPVALAVIF